MSPDSFLLGLEIVLKAAFIGNVLSDQEPTRYGPLHIKWMDDPNGCRDGYLSRYAPAPPPLSPFVIGVGVNPDLQLRKSLFCSGDKYEPSPLPELSPAPSASPSVTPVPTPSPTLSDIHHSQIKALQRFYTITNMAAISQKHNWFPLFGAPFADYCSYTGLTCSEDGFIFEIDLNKMGLSGNLTIEALRGMRRLQRLFLVDNFIAGPLPELSSLKNLVQLELSGNKFTGSFLNEILH